MKIVSHKLQITATRLSSYHPVVCCMLEAGALETCTAALAMAWQSEDNKGKVLSLHRKLELSIRRCLELIPKTSPPDPRRRQ